MVTKLDRTLRREVAIRHRPYIVTLDGDGLRLTLKGHRKGQELRWDDFVSGDAAFAVALNASLSHANDKPPQRKALAEAKPRARSRAKARTRAPAKRRSV